MRDLTLEYSREVAAEEEEVEEVEEGDESPSLKRVGEQSSSSEFDGGAALSGEQRMLLG